MSIIAIEGIVTNGQIQLKAKVRLPNRTKVYVVVPDVEVEQSAHVYSPRLAHREEAKDFVLEIEESADA